MNRYIVAGIVIGCMFWCGVGYCADKPATKAPALTQADYNRINATKAAADYLVQWLQAELYKAQKQQEAVNQDIKKLASLMGTGGVKASDKGKKK